MTIKDRTPKLHCYTAKYKLTEARYFLNKFKDESIWNNDKSFSYHLNAFVNSADSVIDYVHSDFMIHKLRIDWQKWNLVRNNDKKRGNFIDKHPKKIGIRRFRKQYKNEVEILLKNPIANYFHFKRNKILHIRWSATSFSSLTKLLGKPTKFTNRYLESTFLLGYKKQHGINATYEMFDDRQIDRATQDATLQKLAITDVRIICKEFLELLKDFIDKFDGRNFLS